MINHVEHPKGKTFVYDNNTPKIKHLQIPIIKNNVVAVSECEGSTNYFIGVKKEGEKYESDAKRALLEAVPDGENFFTHFFDFQNSTKIADKHWYVEDVFNIYENKSVTDKTALVLGDSNGYEKVLWLCVRKC